MKNPFTTGNTIPRFTAALRGAGVAASLLSAFASYGGTCSSNNRISGFHYSSCDSARCIEVSSADSWLSQLNGGFSTKGATEFKILDAGGRLRSRMSGFDATLNPDLDLLTLQLAGGGFLIYSIRDGGVSRFPGVHP